MSHLQQSSDVAIIGGGVMGLAAAASTGERGHSVTLFEAEQLAGPLGGSHGRARIIRQTYGRVRYCELARAALARWDRLGEDQNIVLYQRTGSLDLDVAGHDGFASYRSALTTTGIPFEILTPEDVEVRFPQIVLPDGRVGLYQADSAVLHADLCIEALRQKAIRYGVDIRTGTSVTAIAPCADSVAMNTPLGLHHAGQLVLAAGARNRNLLRDLGLELSLTFSREQVSFFHPKSRAHHDAGRVPIMIFHLGTGVLGSVFPILRDDPVKIMIENKGQVDVDTADMNTLKTQQIRDVILPHLPQMSDRLAATDTCHYVMTPDEDFVVDRHPTHANITICSACSGHGFKFAPVLGEQIATLVGNESESPDPLFAIDAATRPELIL